MSFVQHLKELGYDTGVIKQILKTLDGVNGQNVSNVKHTPFDERNKWKKQ